MPIYDCPLRPIRPALLSGMGTRRQWPRPRRDVCSSRDLTETLKCTFITARAVLALQALY